MVDEAEAPVAEAPVAEAPVAEAPATEVPAAEAPPTEEGAEIKTNTDVTEDEGYEEESSEGDEEESSEGEHRRAKEGSSLEDELWADMEGEGEGEGEVEGEEKLPEEVHEEEGIPEEPPPDPSAPYNLSDSDEALKAPFELRPDQIIEIEDLWALYQDYTPAYTDIKDYITAVELVYMLKALNLQTFTPEQMYELIDYCVRPPHPDGYINFQQFLWMVTIRQRDMPIEEELRLALEVMDPEKTGLVDREYFREKLNTMGHKVKNLDALIKEVDMANDGTLGIEDIIGTVCIDLNRDDIILLQNQINPPEVMVDVDNLL